VALNPEQVGNRIQLYTLARPYADGQYPALDRASPLLSYVPDCDEEDRWRIRPLQVSVQALEVARVTSPVAPTVPPLPEGRIVNLADELVFVGPTDTLSVDELAALPLYAGRYSALKLRVRLGDGTAYAMIRDLDLAGGDVFSFAAASVQVDVLWPSEGGGSVVAPGQDLATVPLLTAPGVVLDTIVQAAATPQRGYIGRRCARWSLSRRFPGVLPQTWEIPPGARTVTILADPVPVAGFAAAFVLQPLPAVGVPAVGIVPLGSLSRPTSVPSTARWLQVTPSAPLQHVTAVFDLDW
jgi:hypothetical protein